MRRVIISGGGTGGHIYPAITIARAIADIEPTEFLYVGSKIGLENTLIPNEGIPFVTIDVRGLERKISFRNLVTLGKTAGSLLRAEQIIHKFKPDVVIGTGGFVCGPVLLAASLSGIPTLVQEQNVIPGVTNTILSRFVKCVALGYEEAADRFKRKDILVYTGNPVRKDILTGTRDHGRALLGLDPDKFTLLVAGGSRGARSINNAMIEVHRYFRDSRDIQILHVTGDHEYDRVVGQLEGIDGKGRYGEGSHIIPYLHHMPEALAAADLAVYRAGAVGLAELTVRGLPAILIPYPYAAEDHQRYNAQALVMCGAAKMILDKMLTGRELLEEIVHLKNDPEALKRMARASKSKGRPQAAHDIAELALSIAKGTKYRPRKQKDVTDNDQSK
ncbi:undecaprenyldiphospho-muramoylpentapeptide beta-N-acetylglucosaminyltransferase [Megasphaera sp. AM44-1BH]|jgi:UDP-N-acetylglucosamine--N-acetylmuramyl-(pentapeptide) pyrophosphoryl-undecaprenol N-acetylglucosamine transferase|uniref:undecaprenyldiphospho-muramoylpentapeptide beta-N-acetylglucosaminyltransferase n=1 Tax=Megasphaera sp. AM44-1BH TaxID=2292358 RepID=UPI000E55050A|nr:undecaprenyldiphospho-muramoylpentapeptide beta-N-acetylglucosaminyltransferase [Megasphaera sp. AM44-1BH]RHA11151.1 undecaprenyldiphospho-muramoylpentapeptide beta-N-acetylglucosaminyltransferase [Megasphaera sp. AM44-1BH]